MINAIDIIRSTFVILEIYTLCKMELSKRWEIVKDRETRHAASWDHRDSDTTESLNSN